MDPIFFHTIQCLLNYRTKKNEMHTLHLHLNNRVEKKVLLYQEYARGGVVDLNEEKLLIIPYQEYARAG